MKMFLLSFAFILVCSFLHGQKEVDHYIFFGMDRERISEESFLKNDRIEGAQLKYSWRELEPEKNSYYFEPIIEDLDFLVAHGKKLFIQLQDVTFDTIRVFVPDYVLTDTSYHGGVDIQYIFQGDDDVIVRQGGWVARRWDPMVAARFHKLIFELGQVLDGKIEGINLPETAADFGSTGKYHPEGFTHDGYRDAIMENMRTLKQAFPSSTVIQYANFVPGEWLPWNDKGYLESLFELARIEDVGMGGPDIKIYKKAQMNHSYKFLKAYSESIITGMAVQDGNYEEINPKTGKRVTVPEIYEFGSAYLGLDYIFWCTQEPFYSSEVLPFLEKMEQRP